MKKFYLDSNKIEFYPVINDFEISPIYGCSHQKFYEVTNGFDIYMCGSHIKNYNNFNNIPFSFYFDFGLDYNIFWDYFNIPYKLYEQLNYNEPYIFIHNSSSSGNVFTLDNINKWNINLKDNILLINPCYNMYDINHKFYNIANKYINKDLIHYIELIINADKLYISDSSFMCLSLNLDIKTEECYYISRNNNSYSYIWSKYYPTNPNKKIKIFKQLLI
jgi:hypothetical protein